MRISTYAPPVDKKPIDITAKILLLSSAGKFNLVNGPEDKGLSEFNFSITDCKIECWRRLKKPSLIFLTTKFKRQLHFNGRRKSLNFSVDNALPIQ